MNKLMGMVQVNSSVDSQALKGLGYRLDIKKGGYVSKCGATIIYLYRKPFFGEVRRVPNKCYESHLTNLYILGLKGVIVNGFCR